MRREKRKILIAGFPGTGKTSVGDFLEKNKGFLHIDMEENHNTLKILEDYDNFISEYAIIDKDVVLTWGFSPDEETINCVKKLSELGFKTFWFVGDRVSVEKVCKRRGNFDKSVFDKQIQLLEEWNIPNRIEAQTVNVFNEKGEFKALDKVLNRLGIEV